MSMFTELVKRGWLECPECGSSDLVTYQEPMDLTETIACRECQHKDEISELETAKEVCQS